MDRTDPGRSHSIPERDRLRSPVEALQWDLAKRLLTLGQNVILEWGFWSCEERESVRLEAEDRRDRRVALSCRNANELWDRLSRRNAALPPGTFAVTKDELDEWWGWFEPPGEDEPVPVKSGALSASLTRH